jgi:hypothetical protein
VSASSSLPPSPGATTRIETAGRPESPFHGSALHQHGTASEPFAADEPPPLQMLPLPAAMAKQAQRMPDRTARCRTARTLRRPDPIHRWQSRHAALDVEVRMNDSGEAPTALDAHLASEHDERDFVIKTWSLSSPILSGRHRAAAPSPGPPPTALRHRRSSPPA